MHYTLFNIMRGIVLFSDFYGLSIPNVNKVQIGEKSYMQLLW